MSLKSFLRFVEIQTKLCSLVPFLMGTLYAVYRFGAFEPLNMGIMLVSLLAFDMATTAINNYMDFRTAVKTSGYGYEEHNAMRKFNLTHKSALTTIAILLLVGVVFGVWLVTRTNITILLLGAICAVTGVMYSFGPIPISRTPYGELFSGIIMGFLITIIAAMAHASGSIAQIALDGGMLTVSASLVELFYIFLVSMPAISGIANIMLANNICDMEEDKENKRLTLPLFIGERRALWVFCGLYIVGYAGIIASVAAGVLPLIFSLALLSGVIVFKNVAVFSKRHVKGETFVLSVKNFFAMSAVNLGVMVVCLVIK